MPMFSLLPLWTELNSRKQGANTASDSWQEGREPFLRKMSVSPLPPDVKIPRKLVADGTVILKKVSLLMSPFKICDEFRLSVGGVIIAVFRITPEYAL